MPQVDLATIRGRAKRLRAAAERRQAAWERSLDATIQHVLVERGGAGHAENFARVILPDATGDMVGKVVRARINADSGTLTGTMI
jgi:threonylcarbamoyladenosine tRNA methylthiotransferase MtaB